MPTRMKVNRIPSKEQPIVAPSFTSLELFEMEKRLYQESFPDFIREAWKVHHPGTPLKWNWHLDAMADHLAAQTHGHIQRLIINVPPGSMKSYMTQVYWPCWEWTFRPTTQVLATAADESLSGGFNQRALWLLQSDWYKKFFNIEMRSDSQAKSKFTNQYFGSREAVPFTSITGHRGDRVIIDDALSAANAESEALRLKVNETYWNSATSRINDPEHSTFTIIQQRLHENDLVGDILEKDEDSWTVLKLPMRYEPTTYISYNGWVDPRKETGELLFPKHWSEATCQKLQAEGPYKWASQYQQDPVPKGDGFFDVKDFKRYGLNHTIKERPKYLHHYMTSDHSLGLNSRSDYQVIRMWGLDEYKNIWLLDSIRKKCKLGDAMGIASHEGKFAVAEGKSALSMIRDYKPLAWFPEGDNNFKALMPMIQETMRSNNIWCRIELASMPTQNKMTKAAAYQAMSNAGKIYLPQGPIGDDALAEYQTFPVGKHDDQVDADSILPRMLQSGHAAVIPPPPKAKFTDDYIEVGDEGGEPENWNMFF